ncbi:MAG: nucleotide pyrophosphatase [Desulfobacteraceae bacterium]|nr:MAG: nucleotide pyrophosphatase [Desulfobacteraceae bacterium]
MRFNRKRCVIVMIDGFGLDYYEKSDMPFLKTMASKGFFKKGKAVFPTLTNANNLSIICGSFPAVHGVTTNCYYDKASGQEFFLEDRSFLKSPTLFEQSRKAGLKSALLTGKTKTLRILKDDLDLGLAAQDPDAETIALCGRPPDIYSIEVNFWLLQSGIKLLKSRKDLDVMYIHTTDYAMHRWAPEESESQRHLAGIDRLLADAFAAAPDALFIVTADHGMNPKKRCLDLRAVCARKETPVQFVLSPVADRLLEHHGGHGGVAYVYLFKTEDRGRVMETLLSVTGVEEVLSAGQAAAKYDLNPSRIGDIVVTADRETVFGQLDRESVELNPGYRNHGSIHEQDIPLIVYNDPGGYPDERTMKFNFDLTHYYFF